MSPSSRRNLALGFLALAILVLSQVIGYLAATMGWPIPASNIPYGRSGEAYLLSVVIVLGAAAWFLPRPVRLLRSIGLHCNGLTGPLLTALATLPFWIVLGLQNGIPHDWRTLDLVMLAVLFPLAAEIVFRGFGFIMIRTRLGWPMPVIIGLQAVLLGIVHWISFRHTGPAAIEVLVISIFGGVVIALLDMLDGYTIWSGLVFHASVNAAWVLFNVIPSAATGWLSTAGQFGLAASAAMALVLLYVMQRRSLRGNRRFDWI